MSLSLPQPADMPCPDCGASVLRAQSDDHRCDPERRLDFVMFSLREEVAAFDRELRAYLDAPRGRFAQWDAENHRLSPPGPGV
jgi:hypothetical protein